MPSKKTAGGYWSGIPRLNICWVGGAMESRVTAKLIQWVYLVDEGRQATSAEVRALCKKK
jgi:hypothetical protein